MFLKLKTLKLGSVYTSLREKLPVVNLHFFDHDPRLVNNGLKWEREPILILFIDIFEVIYI